LKRFLARLMPPRSWCASCGHPFFSDRRRRCRCGDTARLFTRSLADGVVAVERAADEVDR
jgi:hypothetical protein